MLAFAHPLTFVLRSRCSSILELRPRLLRAEHTWESLDYEIKKLPAKTTPSTTRFMDELRTQGRSRLYLKPCLPCSARTWGRGQIVSVKSKRMLPEFPCGACHTIPKETPTVLVLYQLLISCSKRLELMQCLTLPVKIEVLQVCRYVSLSSKTTRQSTMNVLS